MRQDVGEKLLYSVVSAAVISIPFIVCPSGIAGSVLGFSAVLCGRVIPRGLRILRRCAWLLAVSSSLDCIPVEVVTTTLLYQRKSY